MKTVIITHVVLKIRAPTLELALAALAQDIKIGDATLDIEYQHEDVEEDDSDPYYGPDDTPPDTPSLENCDDAGTGEGRWHGRM